MSTQPKSTTWDPASPELAHRIERVIRDGGLSLVRTQLAAGGGVAGFREAGCRFNRIYGLGLEGPCAPADLKQLVAFLEAKGAPRPVVETSPASHPGAEDALRTLGFEIADRLEVLVRRPEAEPASEEVPTPRSEVRVQEVVAPDDATLRGFVELMHFGFNPEARTVPDQALRDGMQAGRNEGADLFVATLHGRQIGAAQAVTRDGITILFGASVLKAYRRRGAQQALLRARMERGRTRGGEWAAVFCLPNSATYRNAERLGFVRSYTRLQWREPER